MTFNWKHIKNTAFGKFRHIISYGQLFESEHDRILANIPLFATFLKQP